VLTLGTLHTDADTHRGHNNIHRNDNYLCYGYWAHQTWQAAPALTYKLNEMTNLSDNRHHMYRFICF